jgi:hypothetical protein
LPKVQHQRPSEEKAREGIRRTISVAPRRRLATCDSRDAEILALRDQILVLQCQIERPRFNKTDRTILAPLSRGLDHMRRSATFPIVKPETVLRCESGAASGDIPELACFGPEIKQRHDRIIARCLSLDTVVLPAVRIWNAIGSDLYRCTIWS